jgi:hypothetical protein
MLEGGASTTLFACEHWVSFWKEYYLPPRFSKVRNLILFHAGLFRWIVETHVTLDRKATMLEGGASSTLFPCENWELFPCENSVVSNTACQSGISKVGNTHFLPYRPLQLNYRNKCISWKKSINV